MIRTLAIAVMWTAINAQADAITGVENGMGTVANPLPLPISLER